MMEIVRKMLGLEPRVVPTEIAPDPELQHEVDVASLKTMRAAMRSTSAAGKLIEELSDGALSIITRPKATARTAEKPGD